MANVELTDTNGKNGFLNEGDVIAFSPAPEGSVVGKNPVGRPKSPINEDRVRELYERDALPLGAVAATLGIATLTLRKRMEEFGIKVRGRGRPVKRNTLEVREAAIVLDANYTESDEANEALTALLEAEAAELAAKAEAEAKAAETPAEPTPEA